MSSPRLLKLFPEYLEYEGFPPQQAVVDDESRIILVAAASRSGKTYGGGQKFVKKLIHDWATKDPDEEYRYWLVGATYGETSIMKRELIRRIPEWFIDDKRQGKKRQFFDYGSGQGMLFLRDNIIIDTKSSDRPEGLVAEKIRGIWVDEAARSKYKAWPNIYSRLSNYEDSWLIMTTSPTGHNWWYEEVWVPAIEGRMRGASAHTWRAIDSPHIPEQVIADARQNLTPQMFRREFEASFEVFAGQIYDEFNRDIHLKPLPFQPEKIGVFVDVNVASDMPAAFSVAAIAGGHGQERVHILSEFYKKGIGIDGLGGYCDAIHEAYQAAQSKYHAPVTVVIDPSAAYVRAKLIERGLNVVNAKNDVVEGIQRVMLVLHPINGHARLTIDPACKHMVNEMLGYHWKVTSDGVIREEPEKLNDHLMDGLRYGCMHFVRPYAPAKQVR